MMTIYDIHAVDPATPRRLLDLAFKHKLIAPAVHMGDHHYYTVPLEIDRLMAFAAEVAASGVPLPPATFRQGNWSHPAGDGSRIVGWVIPAADVERMGADAYVLPGEVADALTRLAAAPGVPATVHCAVCTTEIYCKKHGCEWPAAGVLVPSAPAEPAMPDADVQDESGLLATYRKRQAFSPDTPPHPRDS